MTPTQFNTEVDRAISVCKDRQMLGSVAESLVNKALGANAFAYVEGIDRLCRALRAVREPKDFGPPTRESIAAARGHVGGNDGVAL